MIACAISGWVNVRCPNWCSSGPLTKSSRRRRSECRESRSGTNEATHTIGNSPMVGMDWCSSAWTTTLIRVFASCRVEIIRPDQAIAFSNNCAPDGSIILSLTGSGFVSVKDQPRIERAQKQQIAQNPCVIRGYRLGQGVDQWTHRLHQRRLALIILHLQTTM